MKLLSLASYFAGKSEISLPRPYLGMSQLGSPCKRYLWYTFRLAYERELSPRQLRIFERGELEEERILRDLAMIGVELVNRQERLVGYKGHLLGHSDGTLKNVPTLDPELVILAEFKTMNEAGFKKVQSQGVNKAYPGYYAQIQMYLKYTNLEICLFISTNKNTEERYYEIVSYDNEEIQRLEKIAVEVIDSTSPPPKVGGPTWYECKTCAAYDICQYNAPIYRGCRTCVNVEVHDEGKWFCKKLNQELSKDEQFIKRSTDSCYEPLLVSGRGS